VRIVLKKRAAAAVEAPGPGLMRCGHRESMMKSDGGCSMCQIRRLRVAWYPKPGEDNYYRSQTGGMDMSKVKSAGKDKKEKRVSAADVLVEQFALKTVKGNEELISLVREATGSKKFDEKQLAWYKSQYRAGKLKGMNGKPGHLIAQGKLTKEAHTRRPKSKAKVVVKKKAAPKAKEAEPVE
jgi:hypothetical protein